MNDQLELRRLRPEDQQSVTDLHVLGLRQADAYVGSGPWDDDLRDIEGIYLRDGGEFLVVLVGKRLIAMDAVQRIDADIAEIRRMRVHPEFQRLGFAQQILDKLESHAIEIGCKVVRLDTSVRQIAAQTLYRKNGYVEIGRQTSGGPLELILFEKLLAREQS